MTDLIRHPSLFPRRPHSPRAPLRFPSHHPLMAQTAAPGADQGDGGGSEGAAFQGRAGLSGDGVGGAIHGDVDDIFSFVFGFVIDAPKKNFAARPNEGVLTDAAQNEYHREKTAN